MKHFFVLLFVIGLTACSESAKNTDLDGTSKQESLQWLEAKKSEYASCVCLMEIRQGVYQGATVYEVRIIDPLCNGVNVVYRADGTTLVISDGQAGYQHYLDNVKDSKQIWACTKGK